MTGFYITRGSLWQLYWEETEEGQGQKQGIQQGDYCNDISGLDQGGSGSGSDRVTNGQIV